MRYLSRAEVLIAQYADAARRKHAEMAFLGYGTEPRLLVVRWQTAA